MPRGHAEPRSTARTLDLPGGPARRPEAPGEARIDKWLWAARFFRTRSLAAQAVGGGRVKLNGQRVKPAREVKPGDELSVHVGELEWVVHVQGIAVRRGPAEQARCLYAETEESRQRRAAAIEARRIRGGRPGRQGARPTKRDRRMIRRFSEGS